MASHNLNFPVYIVDAFVRTGVEKLTGNPAGVVVLNRDDDIDDQRKQEIASEINQPVNAFISRGWTSMDPSNRDSAWTIKWFTPTTELSICGHASLAASSVIFSKIAPHLTFLTLEKRSGEKLEVSIAPETDFISLNFPVCPPTRLSVVDYPWVQELVQKTIGSSPANLTVEDVQYSASAQKIFLRLKSLPDWDSGELIRSVTPDMKGMMDAVDQSFQIEGLAVTIENNNKTGIEAPLYYSRFFAPWSGVDEDHVCGSLQAVLAPYWSKELEKGKEMMMTRFASRRTGDIYVKLLDNNRVEISGKANLTMTGIFFC